MALLDINFHFKRITVQFETPVPTKLLAQADLHLRDLDDDGNDRYRLVPADFVGFEDGARLMVSLAAEKLMQGLMPNYGQCQLGYMIDGLFCHAEDIRFTKELMNMAFDPLALSRKVRPFEDKGPKVAVFTQAFNEGAMLLYWERFYGELVGYENLYVLNNASTDGSCARLNPLTTVINMPAVKVDHFEFAHSHSYFQRFLLMRYHWVIKVDTDELMAFEDGLLATVDRLAPGTYCPELALEPIHVPHAEAAFRFDGRLSAQRGHFVHGSKGLVRPIISSVPTTWTAGNHVCFEASSVLPGFAIVHLKYFDFDFLHEKNRKWAQMKASDEELRNCQQINTLRTLDEDAIHAFTGEEIAERVAMQAVALPAWLHAAL